MHVNKIILSFLCAVACACAVHADTIPDASRLRWHVSLNVAPSFVPPTNTFLKGDNSYGRKINAGMAAGVRAGFSFGENSLPGQLYPDVYQGVGVQANSFFAPCILGTPVSAYLYQGAPFLRLGTRLSLGYEWEFGAAFGWKHSREAEVVEDVLVENASVSTSVTAHMALALKFRYALSERWMFDFGLKGSHFSNGNTSYPNGGVNTVGATVGLTYLITPSGGHKVAPDPHLVEEADRPHWFYDVMAYGAWRRRIVTINDVRQLCPGKFAVAGLQFAPMRQLNRWVAVGGALDLRYDESAGIAPYWVEGTEGINIKFYRPSFGKQLSAGVSAHAELTMPIFALNAGLGYDILSPDGDKRFYQSLTLKAFVTRTVFLNAGYRLGAFKDPQNLMLGIGVRL